MLTFYSNHITWINKKINFLNKTSINFYNNIQLYSMYIYQVFIHIYGNFIMDNHNIYQLTLI